MNEFEIECAVCESGVIVYNDTADEPCFCPMCGSALTPTEVNDV